MCSTASTSDGSHGGKIVGLGGNNSKQLRLSVEYLNSIFSNWKSIIQLRQLSLRLPTSCDEIRWPDLSDLRVLEIESIIESQRLKLDGLLPHLSTLESLKITNMLGSLLYFEDCVAIEHHLNNTSTLKHITIKGCECSVPGLLALAGAIHDHPTLQGILREFMLVQ